MSVKSEISIMAKFQTGLKSERILAFYFCIYSLSPLPVGGGNFPVLVFSNFPQEVRGNFAFQNRCFFYWDSHFIILNIFLSKHHTISSREHKSNRMRPTRYLRRLRIELKKRSPNNFQLCEFWETDSANEPRG